MVSPISKLSGLDPVTARALTETINGLVAEVAELRKQARTTGLQRAGYMAREGETARMRGGERLTLPRSRAENTGAEVRVIVETAGTVEVVAHRSLVNGEALEELAVIGLYTFQSNGAGGWFSSASSSAGGVALSAEYVLGAAHPDLPAGRVATDSTEIDADLTVANVISWALRTASVAFSKLADLTGLSVLGRASNTSGVMAAITATAARQALMSDSAGTAIAWRAPTYADLDTASGLAVLARATNTAGVLDPLLVGAISGKDGFVPVVNEAAQTITWARAKTLATENTTTSHGLFDRINFIDSSPGVAWDLSLVGTRLDVTASVAGGALNSEPYVTYSATAGLTAERVTTSSTSVTVDTSVANQIQFQSAAKTGAIAAAANSNATFFAGIRDNGSAETDRTNLNFVSGTNTTATVTDDAGNDELEIRFNVDDFPLSGLADQAAETFVGNFTSGVAAPTARAGSSVAGGGLTYTAGGTLAVGAGTHITVNANDVTLDLTTLVAAIDSASIASTGTTLVREALVGEVTAPTNSNTTTVTRSTNFASSPWTGAHTWSGTNSYSFSTTGDFDVVAGAVGLDSDTTMLLHADNDLTVESDADVVIGCDALRVHSTSGPGVAGFIVLDAVAASTPTLADEEGMYWVLTGGVNPSTAAFTNDSDEDWMLAQGGTNLTITNATGNLGTIDISTVPCGGTVIIGTSATGAHQIEGFSAKPDGFFFFVVSNTSQTTQYLNQDATPTATSRIQLAGNVNSAALGFHHAMFIYGTSRWRGIVAATGA